MLELEDIEVSLLCIKMETVDTVVSAAEGNLIHCLVTRNGVLSLQVQQAKVVFPYTPASCVEI